MNNRYFQALLNDGCTEAQIDIYGDITSWECLDSDMSSWTLSQWLNALPDTVETVNVRINSYGGEVAEGVAIFNALKAHKAKVRTVCDGFACSIASVIFCAGDERVMNEASLLFIHNASSCAYGTAEDMRRAADDVETITSLSKAIYEGLTDYEDGEIDAMMDAETWICPQDALEHGWATSIEMLDGTTRYAQSARETVMRRITDEMPVAEAAIDYGRLAQAISDAIAKQHPEEEEEPPGPIDGDGEGGPDGDDDPNRETGPHDDGGDAGAGDAPEQRSRLIRLLEALSN